jgi:hypothetical protein
MNLYEGLGLALAVIGSVMVGVLLVAVAGVCIDRVAKHYDGIRNQ